MEIRDIFGFLIAAVFVGFSILQRMARAKQESGGGRPRTPWPGPVAQPPAGTGMPQPAWPAPPRPAQQPPQPPQQRRALADEEGPEEDEFVEREVERFSRESERFDRQQIEGVAQFERQSAQFERQSAEFAGRQLNGLGGGLVSSEAATVTEDVSGVDMGLQGALGDPAAAARAVVLAEVLGKPKALRASHRYR